MVELGKCDRCDGLVVEDDVYDLSSLLQPRVRVARCIKCGERYYEGFPKRSGNKYNVCLSCGRLFKKKHNKKIQPDLCKICESRDTQVKKCIVCGVPIKKGFTCTKIKCKRAKGNPVESLKV